MASFRYRAQIPAQVMGAGVNSGEADIVIFSKPVKGDLEIAQTAKKDGAKVIVDYCDAHFNDQLYLDMLGIADLVTCASKEMQGIIKGLGRDSEVINDPYEFGLHDPHANGAKYLWFGHQLNLGEIIPLIGKISLEVVTGPNNAIKGYVPWSVDNLSNALERSNIVLIPDGKKTRSNNRMVNAIAAGCFVMGGKQLNEWRRFVFSGPLHHGFQFANCFKDELNDLVKEGQDYVYKNHSPEVIGKKWEELCASI